MPKLYEYFGLVILFYSGEHEPLHVHGQSKERESRAEIIVLNGVITEIRYGKTAEHPLNNKEMRLFKKLITARANDIVSKWTDFFALHKPITPERITRRLK